MNTTTNLTLTTADDMRLGATLYEPEVPLAGGAQETSGTVLIHGATAVPQRYYGKFGRYMASRGIRVMTYDYRGVGTSRPSSLRNFRAKMTDWVSDARAAHAFLREHRPGPVAIVAHSFGGQMVGLLDEYREAKGAVFVGSQLGYYRHFPMPSRMRIEFALRALIPATTAVLGYVPGKLGMGEDLPGGVARQWAKWCLHPEYLLGHEPSAEDRFRAYDVPSLFYSFTDDEFAPKRAVRAMLSKIGRAPLAHRSVKPSDFDGKPIGHFGFFRPRFETSLWADTHEFLTRALSGDAFADMKAPKVEAENALVDYLFRREGRNTLCTAA
ncbi:MAG: alpha/beta fold hydrolase [Polyangiaceae bacterium]